MQAAVATRRDAGSSSDAMQAAAATRCGQQQRRDVASSSDAMRAAAATRCGQQQRRDAGSSSDAMWAAATTRCGQQQRRDAGSSSSMSGVVRAAAVWCGAGSSSVVQQECGAGSSTELSISSTSIALQKIKNLRGLQKTCNKNLALLALSGLMSEMARHWQGTGKSKMCKSRQVM